MIDPIQMTPSEYINAASTPEERHRRKIQMYPILYGSKGMFPGSFLNLLTQCPYCTQNFRRVA